MLELVVLGSGSRGNCTLLRCAGRGVLIDAGLGVREIVRRLAEVGQDPATVAGIFLTHEHGDHIAGVSGLARRFRIPVFGNAATLDAAGHALRGAPGIHAFATGTAIEIGPFTVTSFAVPHDAVEPVGYLVDGDGVRAGHVTDLGHVPAGVAAALSGCAALVFEANHDRQMLVDGPYPWVTKQRVGSWQGHLSNDNAAAALAASAGDGVQVVLAHLSLTNNHPDLARVTVERALADAGLAHARVSLASQDRPAGAIRL